MTAELDCCTPLAEERVLWSGCAADSLGRAGMTRRSRASGAASGGLHGRGDLVSSSRVEGARPRVGAASDLGGPGSESVRRRGRLWGRWECRPGGSVGIGYPRNPVSPGSGVRPSAGRRRGNPCRHPCLVWNPSSWGSSFEPLPPPSCCCGVVFRPTPSPAVSRWRFGDLHRRPCRVAAGLRRSFAVGLPRRPRSSAVEVRRLLAAGRPWLRRPAVVVRPFRRPVGRRRANPCRPCRPCRPCTLSSFPSSLLAVGPLLDGRRRRRSLSSSSVLDVVEPSHPSRGVRRRSPSWRRPLSTLFVVGWSPCRRRSRSTRSRGPAAVLEQFASPARPVVWPARHGVDEHPGAGHGQHGGDSLTMRSKHKRDLRPRRSRGCSRGGRAKQQTDPLLPSWDCHERFGQIAPDGIRHRTAPSLLNKLGVMGERSDLEFPSGQGACAAWVYRPGAARSATPR